MPRAIKLVFSVPLFVLAVACAGAATRPGYSENGKVKYQTRSLAWHQDGTCADSAPQCSTLARVVFGESVPGAHDGFALCSNDLRDQLKKRNYPTAEVDFEIDRQGKSAPIPCSIADVRGDPLPNGGCRFISLEHEGTCDPTPK